MVWACASACGLRACACLCACVHMPAPETCGNSQERQVKVADYFNCNVEQARSTAQSISITQTPETPAHCSCSRPRPSGARITHSHAPPPTRVVVRAKECPSARWRQPMNSGAVSGGLSCMDPCLFMIASKFVLILDPMPHPARRLVHEALAQVRP